MNVYDFDNTIYDGESALDFFWFCLKKKPTLLKVLPKVIRDIAKYKACKMSKDEFMERGAYYTESFFSLFEVIIQLFALLAILWRFFPMLWPFSRKK
jgi:hypothetical protein